MTRKEKQQALNQDGYEAGLAGKPCEAPTGRELDRGAWEQGWRSGNRVRQQPATCPWCESQVPPVPTDMALANFAYTYISQEIALRRNPLMCPYCYGVGGPEDWGI